MGNLGKLRWPSERNAAEGVHDDAFSPFVVGPRLLRKPFGEGHGGLGFYPPRCHTYNPNTLWRHFF